MHLVECEVQVEVMHSVECEVKLEVVHLLKCEVMGVGGNLMSAQGRAIECGRIVQEVGSGGEVSGP